MEIASQPSLAYSTLRAMEARGNRVTQGPTPEIVMVRTEDAINLMRQNAKQDAAGKDATGQDALVRLLPDAQLSSQVIQRMAQVVFQSLVERHITFADMTQTI